MTKGTFRFNRHSFRLNEIKSIGPLNKNKKNIDGCLIELFLPIRKRNYQGQFDFTIYFVNSGYREFYSKITDFQGDNEIYDEEFHKQYLRFLVAWEKYHDKIDE